MNKQNNDIVLYLRKLLNDSQDSTFLSPNKQNKTNNGYSKSYITIKINEVDEFCNLNKISLNDLFLTSTMIVLTKFNFIKEHDFYRKMSSGY